jgi:hypothetical protein
MPNGKNADRGEANARLIAEAGTVASEYGLTPRELLEQRNEMLEVLEYFVTIPLDQLCALAEGKVTNIGFFRVAQKKARAVIAKTVKNPPP